MIAIAKGLLGLQDKAMQLELYIALKNAIRSLSRGLLNSKDIEDAITAYIIGDSMFIKLPPATSYDYENLENLQRQAMAALIAA